MTWPHRWQVKASFGRTRAWGSRPGAVDISQSYTIYLFNESKDDVISTESLEVICICAIGP